MLAIRMQRRGRKGHAQFRVILQDSHRSPSTGKVTAYLGSYNPHTKVAQLDSEKIDFYLKHGAQPSNRVAQLLKNEGVKLPKWVTIDTSKKGATKNPDKFSDDDTKNTAADGDTAEEKTEAEPAAEVTNDEAKEATPEEKPDTSEKEETKDEAETSDDTKKADEKVADKSDAKASEDKKAEK